MWTHERQNAIIDLITQSGKQSSNELVGKLGFSRETIRRDLLDLEQKGLIQRVHGGAVLASQPENIQIPTVTSAEPLPEDSYDKRLKNKQHEKEAIGELACELITDGSAIFIDAGTTTLAFAKALLNSASKLKIITNSIDIAALMSPRADFEVLLLGGIPNLEVNATYGELTLSDIDRFRADFAVISPVGVHGIYGFSSYHLREAEVARSMINHANTRIILAHSDKFGVQSRVKICSPESIDHLVVDYMNENDLQFPRCHVHKVFGNEK